MAKKLNVFVGKMPSNYAAYIEEVDGFVITRKTIKELRTDLPEALRLHIEGLYDYEVRDWMSQQIEFIYHYDINSLLDKYQGIFNQSSIARIAGINETLMRQYVSGTKKPRKKQIEKIQNNLHTFASELLETNIL